MRRAPLHSATASGPRLGLALVASLALAGAPALARAQDPGPPPSSVVQPLRPVQVDLRLAPERRLGDARLRITPQQPGLGPASERPIFGPTMTLSLRPGSYSLEVLARRHGARIDLHVTPGMAPVQVNLQRHSRADAPRFRRDKRLANGLAAAALVQVFTGAGLLLAGAVRETATTRRNEALLMDALVDAAGPAPNQPTGLALVEASYSTARYHRDLSRAMTLEVAGGAVAMAGLGAALAAVPVIDESRLRAAYIELGIGAALTAGGAAWLTHFERDRRALLSATDPTQRVTTTDLRPLHAARTGGALLTGLGIGLVVFPAVALLTSAVKRRRDRSTSFAPYMTPGQAGLTLHGRF